MAQTLKYFFLNPSLSSLQWTPRQRNAPLSDTSSHANSNPLMPFSSTIDCQLKDLRLCLGHYLLNLPLQTVLMIKKICLTHKTPLKQSSLPKPSHHLVSVLSSWTGHFRRMSRCVDGTDCATSKHGEVQNAAKLAVPLWIFNITPSRSSSEMLDFVTNL